MLWNVLLSVVPKVVKAVMITTAIRAAIKPYSMAVARNSFEINFFKMFLTFVPNRKPNDGVLACGS